MLLIPPSDHPLLTNKSKLQQYYVFICACLVQAGMSQCACVL